MAKKLLLLVSLFLGALPGMSQAATWVDGDGLIHNYVLVDSYAITWNDAQAGAQAIGMGWDLATITSAAEQAFIDANVFGNLSGEYWIGGYQNPLTEPTATAGWSWVTGEAWNYTNWSAGEPNDNTGPASEQYLGANWNGWYWNDEGALGNIAGYVAETVIPEPSTIILFGAGLVGLLGIKKYRK